MRTITNACRFFSVMALISCNVAFALADKRERLISSELVPQGTEGLILQQLSAISRTAMADEKEGDLQLADFEPSATIKGLLQHENLPSDTAMKSYVLKRAWMPHFHEGKLKHDGGADAIVLRYETSDYIIQTVENRAVFQVIVCPQRGQLSTELDARFKIPKIFLRVLQSQAFPTNKPLLTSQSKVKGGGRAKRVIWHDWTIKDVKGNPMTVDIVWSERFLVYSLARSYGSAANPHLLLGKPLFKQSEPQSADGAFTQVKVLTKSGVASAPELQRYTVDRIKQLRKLSEPTQQHQFTAKKQQSKAIKVACRRMAELVAAAAKEPGATVQMRCWIAAAELSGALPPQFREQASQIACSMIDAVIISDLRDKIAALSRLMLISPVPAEAWKHLNNASGKSPGLKSPLTLYDRIIHQAKTSGQESRLDGFVGALPVAEDCLVFAKKRLADVSSGGLDSTYRAACLGYVRRFVRKNNLLRTEIIRVIQECLKEPSRELRHAAVCAVIELTEGKRRVELLFPMLQDTEAGIREQAAHCLADQLNVQFANDDQKLTATQISQISDAAKEFLGK
ncbi:MAG: hypothetical protein GVY36_18530 [Verrucomicrobia bacterium]|jgi:hypothetical protein|nr:hypothetical protein [Verrucomicrobiota bacterium]